MQNTYRHLLALESAHLSITVFCLPNHPRIIMQLNLQKVLERMPAELKKVKDAEAKVEAEEAAKRALEEYEVLSLYNICCQYLLPIRLHTQVPWRTILY